MAKSSKQLITSIDMTVFRLLFISILFCISVYGCRHDSDTPVPDEKPVLTLEAKPGYVSGSQIIAKNSIFEISVKAESNQYSLHELTRCTIKRNYGSQMQTVSDSLFNSSKFAFVYTFTSLLYADTERWEITIYDKAGNNKTVALNLITLQYPPSLQVIFPTLPMGTSQPFQIAITGSSNNITNYSLKNIRFLRSTLSSTVPFFDSILTGKNIVMFYNLTSHNNPVTETFSVLLEDNNGEVRTVTFKIYVASYLIDEHEGIIYNSLGTGNYGWDLMLNTARINSDSENETDMFNFTDTDEFGAPYYFNNGWMAGNATRFKRANWYEYESATQESAVDAYTGGTISDFPANQATSVSAGDIYISNIRNQNIYCVIKITEVNRTTGDDMDFIRFTYKK
jgi:hypothetical protein